MSMLTRILQPRANTAFTKSGETASARLQIASNYPASPTKAATHQTLCWEKHRTVFLVSQPWGSPQWLAARLSFAGDIEINPGPPKPTSSLPTTTWTCHQCNKHITSRHFSYRCNTAPIHWVHKTCTSTLPTTVRQKTLD